MFWNLTIIKELHDIKMLCAGILEWVLVSQGMKPDDAKDAVLILLWLKEDFDDAEKKEEPKQPKSVEDLELENRCLQAEAMELKDKLEKAERAYMSLLKDYDNYKVESRDLMWKILGAKKSIDAAIDELECFIR